MTDSIRDLLVRGISAAKAGDRREACFYLEWALRLEPPVDQQIDALYWLSEVQSDGQTRRAYLEKILILDSSDGRARRKLAILDGKLDSADIIDPDRMILEAQNSTRPASIAGFTCSQCGGRMTYAPDGTSLLCEYCEFHHRLAITTQPDSVKESDFHIALATRRAHLQPLWAHAITCGGCGAELILESGEMSQACPYCSTTYALDQIEDREIVSPDGILPLEITLAQASDSFSNWIRVELQEKLEPVEIQLVYLPVWTFDLGGQVMWNCQVKRDRQWLAENGLEIVYYNDMLVFAALTLPENLHAALSGYDLSKLVGFDRRYLAGIKAQNYQISAGDASLQARKTALEDHKRKILSRLPSQVKNFHVDSTKMIVEAFRLVLVPAGLLQYEIIGKRYYGLINGQTGDVAAEKPQPRKKSFFSTLFG
jgi:uncharacterized CHY-type Zn-finger protein